MNPAKEASLRDLIVHTFPPEAMCLQDLLLKIMKHMDNVEIISDDVIQRYKILLERHRHSVGIAFAYEEMHNKTAMEAITLNLQTKIIEMARKELGMFGADPLDAIKSPEFETGDSIAEILEKCLKGESISVTIPSVSDHIGGEINGIHFDPLHFSEIAKNNNEVTRLFEKVKKELSDRGDYELDVVTFVDVLIKLGIAKPKD